MTEGDHSRFEAPDIGPPPSGVGKLFKDPEHGWLYEIIIDRTAPNKDHENRLRRLEWGMGSLGAALVAFLGKVTLFGLF